MHTSHKEKIQSLLYQSITTIRYVGENERISNSSMLSEKNYTSRSEQAIYLHTYVFLSIDSLLFCVHQLLKDDDMFLIEL